MTFFRKVAVSGWTALALAGVATAPDPAQAHPAHAQPVEYPLVVGFERFFLADDSEEYLAEGGLLLINELNCVACHAAPDHLKDILDGRPATNLNGVGTRLEPVDIELMIRNPRFIKKGTQMPSLFAGPDRDYGELKALTQFLASLKEPVKPMPKGDIQRGQRLYHRHGCVACHAPETDYRPDEMQENEELELAGLPSVPLNMADRYDLDALGRFLMNPLHLRPSSRMPDPRVTEQEAADLAAYLKSGPKVEIPEELQNAVQGEADAEAGDAGASADEFHPDKALIEEGRKLFAAKNCVACHQPPGDMKAEPRRSKPLLELNHATRTGCLAEKPAGGGVPAYFLDEVQKKAIQIALKHLPQKKEPPTLAQRIDHTMMALNCYACHSRDGKGGPEDGRLPFFGFEEVGAMSLGKFGNLPPDLDHVGRKLQRDWMEQTLFGKEPNGVRPYMSTRMPGFNKEIAGHLVDDFAEADVREEPIEIDVSGLPRHQRGHYGQELMGINGLACVTCHGLKDRKSLGAPVVNLTHTVERLQPEYFKEVLLDPQSVQPGTLMPPMFQNRKKANEEVEQIWTYLKELDQRRLPDGLLSQDDFELKPEKDGRPIVFRTFLDGVGTQAVAVGFPEQIHAAFDSYEVRWEMAWRGRFLDAMSTWDDRFCTPAEALGENSLRFPEHPPIARLKAASDEWPSLTGVGGDADYEFQGFIVDDAGVPTFLYGYQGLSIEDRLEPAGEGFRHRVRISGKVTDGGDGNYYFLGLAKGAKPVAIDLKDGGEFTFTEELTW